MYKGQNLRRGFFLWYNQKIETAPRQKKYGFGKSPAGGSGAMEQTAGESTSDKRELRDMRTIGIIGAMEEEISFLREKMEIVTTKSVLGLSYDIGRYAGNSIVLVKSGIGKVNAALCTQAMIDHFGVDYVINTGVAGALSPELRVGDILISKDAVQHDMDTSVLGDPVGTIPRMAESYFKADEAMLELAKEAAAECGLDCRILEGRVASGDQFISSKEQKEKIRKTVQGDCAEMEGAAIAHACYLNRIPFLIIRAISDDASDDAGMSFDAFCVMAAERSSRLVETMLEHMKG